MNPTSLMCANCGEIIEIPPELQGGPQVKPYYCDACEDRDYSHQEYLERMFGPEDYDDLPDFDPDEHGGHVYKPL